MIAGLLALAEFEDLLVEPLALRCIEFLNGLAAQAAPDDFRALETLALAQFESGRITDAVETQKAAIAACPEEILRKRMEEVLDKFLATVPEKPA